MTRNQPVYAQGRTAVQDRRCEERYPPSGDTFTSNAGMVVENFGPIRIKNLSREGIGLLTSTKVEPDSLLALQLKNDRKSFNKIVMIRIVHVTPQANGYLAGGTFTIPLTYEELMSLIM